MVEQAEPGALGAGCGIPSLGGAFLPLRHLFSVCLFVFFWIVELALSPVAKAEANSGATLST